MTYVRDMTDTELVELIAKTIGVVPQPLPAAPVSKRTTNTRGARKILEDKGYMVKGHHTFKRVLKQFGISCERMGKEDWFSVDALEAVPVRK